jgi:hypothetical protein
VSFWVFNFVLIESFHRVPFCVCVDETYGAETWIIRTEKKQVADKTFSTLRRFWHTLWSWRNLWELIHPKNFYQTFTIPFNVGFAQNHIVVKIEEWVGGSRTVNFIFSFQLRAMKSFVQIAKKKKLKKTMCWQKWRLKMKDDLKFNRKWWKIWWNLDNCHFLETVIFFKISLNQRFLQQKLAKY